MVEILFPWFVDVLELLLLVGEVRLYTCLGICISHIPFLNTGFPSSSNPTIEAIAVLTPLQSISFFLSFEFWHFSGVSASSDGLAYCLDSCAFFVVSLGCLLCSGRVRGNLLSRTSICLKIRDFARLGALCDSAQTHLI